MSSRNAYRLLCYMLHVDHYNNDYNNIEIDGDFYAVWSAEYTRRPC